MTIDLIIASCLLASMLLFAAGRHEAGRRKRRTYRSTQSGGRKFFSQ